MTVAEVTAAEITKPILSGELDGWLETIEVAIETRKSYLQNDFVRNLQPGDKVRVGNIRPKYLQGHIATVAGGIQGDRLYVDFESNWNLRKFSDAKGVGLPINSVKPL